MPPQDTQGHPAVANISLSEVHLKLQTLNIAVEWLAFLLFFGGGGPGSNLCLETSCPGGGFS